jgi:hypothetical protein
MPKGILNKASLVMVPEAPIDGTMPSVFPEDRSGDFTFTRGSNLAATRVASNGLIEKGRENLLLQSNQFDTTWGDDGGTIIGGYEGYDGTNNAWKYTKAGQYDGVWQSGFSISGVHTISVYVKLPDGETDVNSLLFRIDHSGGNTNVVFSLTGDSVPSTGGNGIVADKINVGNGWYRCVLTLNQSTTKVNFRPSFGSNTSGTSGSIYIQDAQLESSMVATSYIESGATTGKAGLLENEPRIDFTGGGCGSLLLEPSRTNLVSQSEYALGLTQYNSPAIVQNHSVSPDGEKNAFEFSTDAATFRGVRPTISITANGTYTASWFVKKRTSAVTAYCGFGFDFNGGTSRKINYIVFDEYNGTATIMQDRTSNTTTDVIDYGDYYRFVATATDTGSNTSLQLTFYPSLSPDGSIINTAANTIVAYGLQVEQGSYATSYIPTYGSAVTRANEEQEATGLSTDIFSSDNLTLFYDFNYNAPGREGATTTYRIFSDSSQLGIKGINNALKTLQVYSSGDFTGTINFNEEELERVRVILRIKNGVCELFFNGTKYSETIDVSGAAPYSWDRMSTLTINSINTSLNKLLGFPTALTDEECSALTQP